MPTPPMTDEALLESVDIIQQHGTASYAARATGKSEATLRRHLMMATARGLVNRKPVMPGFEIVATTSVLDPHGNLTREYVRQKPAEDRGPFSLPEGHTVKGVSALLDANGNVSAQWVKTKQGEPDPLEIVERIKTALADIVPAAPVEAPAIVLGELCTVYGIADAHIGLRSWHHETGSSYDTDLAAERVKDWVAQCVAASPAAHTGIIMDVGDYFHANDDTNQTPTSKHVLDVDTRMFRTLEIGVATLASAVESALTKHQEVRVVVLPGNHNSTIYLAILFSVAERYRDNPRVIVHKKPGEFFVHEFGRVMIAGHHGDKAKADRLVHFVADEYSEIWGRTKHRFLFTGHLHHHKSQDIGGMKWEQLRAVAERDAYAVSHAYSARAQMQAITYHKFRGEIQRVAVNA